MSDEERVSVYQAEIRRLRSVVQELEAKIQEMESPEYKANLFLNLLFEMLPDTPRSEDPKNDPGYWTDKEQILCPSSTEAEIIADFLEDVLREYSSAVVQTGTYEEKEDEKYNTVDRYTGFSYISIE